MSPVYFFILFFYYVKCLILNFDNRVNNSLIQSTDLFTNILQYRYKWLCPSVVASARSAPVVPWSACHKSLTYLSRYTRWSSSVPASSSRAGWSASGETEVVTSSSKGWSTSRDAEVTSSNSWSASKETEVTSCKGWSGEGDTVMNLHKGLNNILHNIKV